MTKHKNIDIYNSHFTKEEIENRLNDFCKENSVDGLGLSTKILWLNCVCETFDEALAYIKSLDEEKYPQVAIQYEISCGEDKPPIREWLVKTQFEVRQKRKMEKGECLDCLYDLLNELKKSTDDMALDHYRAVEIAVALIENSTDKTFEEAL